MKKIIWIVIIILLIGGGYWLYQKGGFNIAGSDNNSEVESGLENMDALTKEAADNLASAELTETYANPDYGFALMYPGELAVTEVPGDPDTGVSDMVLFTEMNSGLGFQVVVSLFDEPQADITPERILLDIPDMVIKDPQDVNLGEDRGKGTTFLDGDKDSPDTSRHIWFAAGGRLYQITAQPAFDRTMQRILGTWQIQ